MPTVTQRSSHEMVLHVEERDSAGRTHAQIVAMKKNPVKPPEIGELDQKYASQIAQELREYPKVLYKTAVSKKKKDYNGNAMPLGDELLPNYPVPFDLASRGGLCGPIINASRDNSGAVIAKAYWQTASCAAYDSSGHVDYEKSKAMETKLLKEGWVSHPSKLEGIPTPQPDEE